MARIDITDSEIIEAIRAAGINSNDAPTDAFTSGEFGQALGISRIAARERLQKLKAENRVECVRVIREALDGRQAIVPAYRLRGAPST